MRAFDQNQKRMIGAAAAIEIARMLGLNLGIPVFTLYGKIFTSSSLLIGIALGAYGLAMAIFQILFGILSDRFGSKNVIMLGMIPYIIGNLIAWHPFNIYGLIVGRLIAGTGAVTSLGMAMVQESVSAERRDPAMALLGIPIGFSFMVSVVLGPVISVRLGVDSLFLISAILGMFSLLPMLIVKYRRPQYSMKERRIAGRIGRKAVFVGVVGFLVLLNMIVFFYYLSLQGTSAYGAHGYELLLLLPVVIGGAIAVLTSGFAALGYSTLFSVIDLVVMLISIPIVFFEPIATGDRNWFFAGTIVYFIGFTLYEVVFTPLISKLSTIDGYGANIGIYNTMQFLGQFVGGVAGGTLVTLELKYDSVLRTTITPTSLVLLSLVFLYIPTKFRETDQFSSR